MTDTADRIARLREWATPKTTIHREVAKAILALCDDYETLAARCTLTDDEAKAVRWGLERRLGDTHVNSFTLRAVLRRLLGETQ